MQQPLNYPSLAELLAGYKNTGVADGINKAATNFNEASQVAGNRAYQVGQLQNTQQANQTAQQVAGTQQQQADQEGQRISSQILSPEDAAAILAGNMPQHPMNQTVLDTLSRDKTGLAIAIANRQAQALQAQQQRQNELNMAKIAANEHTTTANIGANSQAGQQYQEAAHNLVTASHWYNSLGVDPGAAHATAETALNSARERMNPMVSVTLPGGHVGSIPVSQVAKFKQDHPNAVIGQ